MTADEKVPNPNARADEFTDDLPQQLDPTMETTRYVTLGSMRILGWCARAIVTPDDRKKT